MISSISVNKNINFGNNSGNEKINTRYEVQKKNNRQSTKLGLMSAVAGLGTGGAAKLVKKDVNTAFKCGVGAYFVSLISLQFLKGIKNCVESKETYKKYEQDKTYKNGFDKFIASVSTPEKIDFGNEEKDKTYYDLALKDNMRSNKISICSLGIGALAGAVTGMVCLAKKLPNKLDKISAVSLVSTAIPLLIGNIATIPERAKEYNNQSVK